MGYFLAIPILSYETLYAFILATAILAISPGPDNIYVLTQSLVHGKKQGLATVAGLISGCLVHTTLLALGVSALILANDKIYYAIKIFGAAYLIYLAIQVYRSDDSVDFTTGNVPRKSLSGLFKQGFIMNVLNPKVTIFFLAFFPGFLFSDQLGNVLQFYILGAIFMIVSFLIFAIIVLLAGSVSQYLENNSHAGIFLKWLQIGVFIGIAIFLLFSN